jgi:hypothetical protein
MTTNEKVRVKGVLKGGHKGPAVEVSFDPAAKWKSQQAALWPGRRGYAVEVLLNGIRFRSAIVSRMRRFFVLVDESIARRAGSAVGKAVTLTLWADTASLDTKATVGKARAGDGGHLTRASGRGGKQ